MFRFRIFFLLTGMLLAANGLLAQCSICTRTAQQQGKTAAEGLNGGIVYLMALPLLVGGYIGYRWWKNEQLVQQQEQSEP